MSDYATDARFSEDGFSWILHDVISFIQGYVMIVIMSVGVVGNSLSMIVFYRVRRRNDATIHYLSTLAVTDTCCIVFVGMALWLSRGLESVTNGRVTINLFQMSTISCKVHLYLFLLLQSISAWIIAAFSLERAVVVWFPLKRSSITATRRKRFLILVCVSLSLICLYTPILSDVLEVDGLSQCFYDPKLWLFFTLLENSLFYFIPGAIIFISNLLIVLGIVLSGRNMTKTGVHPKENQDRKSLINLFIVSAMYLVFMTPSTVIWTKFIIATQRPIDPGYAVTLNELGNLFHQWSIINYCFNFIVYSTSLPFFQAELKTIVNLVL